jgi:hypothetical protein
MILPSNEECQRVVKELEDEPSLTQWQSDFIDSNRGRAFFTDRQKEIIAELIEKYEV